MKPLGRRRCSLLVLAGVSLVTGHFTSRAIAWLQLGARTEPLSYDAVDRRAAMLGVTTGVAGAAGGSLPGTASAATAKVPSFMLSNGLAIPQMALNTAGLTLDQAETATRAALSAGISHIDFHPGRERDGVARVIASQGRGALFLTTKISKFKNKRPDPVAAAASAKKQIEDDFTVLGVNSVDMLMLRDSPSCEVMQAQWAVLEDALASGQTRAIGVINFCEKALRCLLSTAKETPAVNYFMLHVGMGPDAHGLRSFGETRGIKTFAYGPLGEPAPDSELLQSSVVKKIAEARGRSPAQVALRWVAQSGVAFSVRPTAAFGLGQSTCEQPGCSQGLEERVKTFDWTLTAKEMAKLDAMTFPDGNPTLFASSGCPTPFQNQVASSLRSVF